MALEKLAKKDQRYWILWSTQKALSLWVFFDFNLKTKFK